MNKLNTKLCSICDQTKSVEEFSIRKKATGLRRRECKPCVKVKSKEYRKINGDIYNSTRREKVKDPIKGDHLRRVAKSWRDSNPDKKKAQSRANYAIHKSSINARARENRQNNLEQTRADRKAYYIANREKLLELNRNWRDSNQSKESKNHYMRSYHHEKKNDPSYSLARNLRGRLYHAVKSESRASSTLVYLGCSIPELKVHLEDQFANGMSWDNYGEWHIDHIRPLASFDLTSEEELHKACHHSNLQPLWAIDNIMKGARYGEKAAS